MLRRLSSKRKAGAQGDEGPDHRCVIVADEAATLSQLAEEPWREGPPSTGPGIQTNEVITSQYTCTNFLFKNLLRQFRRPANVYFLFISCLQCIKAVSITNGVPTTLLPLLFVLTVTALKDAIEDFNRHRADNIENNRIAHNVTHQQALDTHKAEDIKWRDIKVSNLIIVRNRELIPADMILLATSESNGLGFVMTANLDGETNLKAKEVKKELLELSDKAKIKGATILCELPNNKLEHFEGTYVLSDGRKISLTARNILLRGCMLRNTEWVLGVVVGTSKEAKIQMNAADAPQKIGSMRRFVDRMTFSVFCLQFWTYIIIFTNFVPISALVTLDMVKFFQGTMMMFDLNMYHEATDNDGKKVEIPMQVRCSDLNEELGVIEHVFSDKTGTLTSNMMLFCKCSIGGTSYGLGITQIGRAYRERNGLAEVEPPLRDPSEPRTPYVNIIDPGLAAVMKDPNHPNYVKCREFFLHLSLNHDVMPEGETEEKLVYSASSPDESALVYAAKHFGFFFCKREPGRVYVRVSGEKTVFNVLHVLEFTSDRKKSSVILKRDDGSIVLFCKGADNIIKSRLGARINPPEVMARIEDHLIGYVNDGLRTLLLAKAELDTKQYEDWAERYHDAETSPKDRDLKRWALMEEIERDLEVMGVTAIEDKLQDGVPAAIASLREAGVKVWMLTGDKVDTAINIGHSCSLLSMEMKLLRLCGEDGKMAVDGEKVPKKEAIEEEMKRLIEREVDGQGTKALVVDTYALAAILKYELETLMVSICRACVSVVCARVSPKQKAKVVQMVKTAEPTVQTLSIGDGANDVPMIQTAAIGVGIWGLEGQQAVNNSDYAIGQFRFLADLLLVHGRWNNRRTFKVICYMYYKNAVLVLPQFLFGIYSLYSGQNFYYDGFYQLYNVFYTAFPIIALGVLDKDVSAKTAKSTPTLYRDGLEKARLSSKLFWGWMTEGIVHAVLVTFIPLYGYGFFNIISTAQNVGLWDLGTCVFLSVFIVVTLRLAIEVADFQWIITALLLASVAVWWVTWIVFASWLDLAPSMYGTLTSLAGSGRFWMCFLLATVASFAISFALESFIVVTRPRRSQIVQEIAKGWGGNTTLSTTTKNEKPIGARAVTSPSTIAISNGKAFELSSSSSKKPPMSEEP